MYLTLLYIAIILTWIIDVSGIIDSLEKGLSKWLKCKVIIPKPFSCSLCSTWWVSLIYLLFTGNLSLIYVVYITVLCTLTPIITDLFVLLRETLNYIIGKGFDKIN